MAVSKHSESANHAAPAGEDLTGKLNYFAKLNGDGEIVLCGDGEPMLGTITEENVENASASVHFGDILKVVAAAAINAGALVSSAAGGKANTAASGDYVAGMALYDVGADGELVSIARIPVGRAA